MYLTEKFGYAVAFFAACSFLGCDGNGLGDDVLYPGAPVLNLEKISFQQNDDEFILRFMITAKKPVPYNIKVTLSRREQGTYLFNNDMELLRNTIGANYDLHYTEEEHVLEETRQVTVGVFSTPRKMSFVIEDELGNRKVATVQKRLNELTLEIKPWSGVGSEPYNVGMARLTIMP